LAAVTTPPHVVAPEADAVFTRPAGYASVKAAAVAATAFGLVSVMVRTLVSPVPITAGVNALVADRLDSTVRVAVAVLDEPALAEVAAPVELT